jgi:predicted nucleic-acid-binding protein
VIAVDTNVLVRLLTGDEPEQARRSGELFARNRVFIPKTVVLETEWVLRYAYGFEPEAIVSGLRNLFGLANVNVEDLPAVKQALDWHAQGFDFADGLHLASSTSARQFATFDRALVKAAKRIGASNVVTA